MAEDLYAKPDLTKKVQIQTDDIKDNIDTTRIYDNMTKKSSPPKVLENMTEDQLKDPSVTVNPEKKDYHRRVAAVFLVLLCICLLVTVTVLSVLSINLRNDRDKLLTKYSEAKSLNVNLTQKTIWLEKENTNLTKERDEILKLMEETCCPDHWVKFGDSCYFISTMKKSWNDSRTFCQDRDADLVIISSREEQTFIGSFGLSVWIGLSDEETENVWKWINGSVAIETYWKNNQPDNELSQSRQVNYVHIHGSHPNINNWNDVVSWWTLLFVCEKRLK